MHRFVNNKSSKVVKIVAVLSVCGCTSDTINAANAAGSAETTGTPAVVNIHSKSNYQNKQNKPLYCTSDEFLLNDSDIASATGFFIKYDSRTRNPKYVVQRSFYTTAVRGRDYGYREGRTTLTFSSFI